MMEALLALVLTLGGVGSVSADPGTPVLQVALVPSDLVAQLLRQGEAIAVVDLRTRAEYDAGHIPGAVSVPFAEVADRLGEIPRGRRVLLYCQCPLEHIATTYTALLARGYRNHAVLAEGFAGWVARGHPLQR
jgi:rhodanese-related sulfurtransferase